MTTGVWANLSVGALVPLSMLQLLETRSAPFDGADVHLAVFAVSANGGAPREYWHGFSHAGCTVACSESTVVRLERCCC
jgi:hypothetical protein